jgi:hypothetical protein
MLRGMQHRQDPERMRRVLTRRERHGWSWAELSRRSGLPVWKLHWWSKRLERGAPAGRVGHAFVRVRVVAPPRSGPAALEVVTASGVRIRVPADFDAAHLRRLLEALEPAC